MPAPRGLGSELQVFAPHSLWYSSGILYPGACVGIWKLLCNIVIWGEKAPQCSMWCIAVSPDWVWAKLPGKCCTFQPQTHCSSYLAPFPLPRSFLLSQHFPYWWIIFIMIFVAWCAATFSRFMKGRQTDRRWVVRTKELVIFLSLLWQMLQAGQRQLQTRHHLFGYLVCVDI